MGSRSWESFADLKVRKNCPRHTTDSDGSDAALYICVYIYILVRPEAALPPRCLVYPPRLDHPIGRMFPTASYKMDDY